MHLFRRTWLIVGILITALLVPLLASAQSATPQDQLAALNRHVETALVSVQAGDIERARAEYAAFDSGWEEVEDEIRATSKQSYRDIEEAMGDTKFALKQQAVDPVQVMAALEALETANETFIHSTAVKDADSSEASPPQAFATALPLLDEAITAAGNGDMALAYAKVESFRAAWPSFEGIVAAKDGAAYHRSEDLQAQATAQLKAGQAQQAAMTLEELKRTLQPFATTQQTYGVFDAMSILLREGLEALLIIAALLAFLQKSGNADKRRWIWIGGAAGVAASILVAVALQMLFSSLFRGANAEIVEGITGLIAAALLFYVSFWLHSKTHLVGWQRYLKDKTSSALATGSLLSLVSLAFLSVFREGAETVLFYIGIAPAIAARDLLLGMGLGTGLLVVLGIIVIGLGKRVPLKPFFQITSLLIWYLGFKFIGTGIHALQVARVVPETNAAWFPSSELLGLYSTWETTLPQLVLLVVAVVVVLWMRSMAKQTAHISAATKH